MSLILKSVFCKICCYKFSYQTGNIVNENIQYYLVLSPILNVGRKLLFNYYCLAIIIFK